MNTASITSQGQVTIPAEVRKKLGLKKGDKINFIVKDGKAEIELVKDLLEMKGILKHKAIKGKTIDEIIRLEHKAVEAAIIERYIEKEKRSGNNLSKKKQ